MKTTKGKDWLFAEVGFTAPVRPFNGSFLDIIVDDPVAPHRDGFIKYNVDNVKPLEVDMAQMEALIDAERAALDVKRRVDEMMDRMLFSYLVMAFTVGIPHGYTITMKRWTMESHMKNDHTMVFQVPDIDVFRIEYHFPIGVLP